MSTDPRPHNVEHAMLAVLDYVIEQGGEVADEPGHVLSGLAAATGLPYKAVSVAVLALEQVEFVQVERAVRPDAHQANRICRVVVS